MFKKKRNYISIKLQLLVICLFTENLLTDFSSTTLDEDEN